MKGESVLDSHTSGEPSTAGPAAAGDRGSWPGSGRGRRRRVVVIIVAGIVIAGGAYVVRGDQVRWVPAVDVTIAALASLGLLRMLARAWTGQRRHRRRS